MKKAQNPKPKKLKKQVKKTDAQPLWSGLELKKAEPWTQ